MWVPLFTRLWKSCSAGFLSPGQAWTLQEWPLPFGLGHGRRPGLSSVFNQPCVPEQQAACPLSLCQGRPVSVFTQPPEAPGQAVSEAVEARVGLELCLPSKLVEAPGSGSFPGRRGESEDVSAVPPGLSPACARPVAFSHRRAQRPALGLLSLHSSWRSCGRFSFSEGPALGFVPRCFGGCDCPIASHWSSPCLCCEMVPQGVQLHGCRFFPCGSV